MGIKHGTSGSRRARNDNGSIPGLHPGSRGSNPLESTKSLMIQQQKETEMLLIGINYENSATWSISVPSFEGTFKDATKLFDEAFGVMYEHDQITDEILVVRNDVVVRQMKSSHD